MLWARERSRLYVAVGTSRSRQQDAQCSRGLSGLRCRRGRRCVVSASPGGPHRAPSQDLPADGNIEPAHVRTNSRGRDALHLRDPLPASRPSGGWSALPLRRRRAVAGSAPGRSPDSRCPRPSAADGAQSPSAPPRSTPPRQGPWDPLTCPALGGCCPDSRSS